MQASYRYRLTDQDIFELFFVMSPEDMANEFEGRSPSARTIRNRLKKLGIPTLSKAIRKAIEERAVDVIPYKSFEENEKAIRSALRREREIHVRLLWERIEGYEYGL